MGPDARTSILLVQCLRIQDGLLPEPVTFLPAMYSKADRPHTSIFQLSPRLTHIKFLTPFLYLAEKWLGKSDLGETIKVKINALWRSFKPKPLQIPGIRRTAKTF